MCLYSGIVLQQGQKYYSIKAMITASENVILMSVPVFWCNSYQCIYGRSPDILGSV